ncbi:hypothetical protein SJI19_00720 [Acerihabitans sp. TG2]|uniref:hypothetical protein n=1 Tax=Acerihabitans sp. TG2 TaxID=3096008 RepID=UPI002B226AC2|nr:hypothetical protein [Acerihabitans sp. TG2]MEA9389084.1 hypothetical protein [Acerihabitans sp. TG2]
MNIYLDYYNTYGPSGNIYVRCLGNPHDCKITYQLYRENKRLETTTAEGDELVVFNYNSPGCYTVHADIFCDHAAKRHLITDEIKPVPYDLLPPPIVAIKSLKGPLALVPNQQNVLVVKFISGGLEKLNHEPSLRSPIYYQLRHGIRFIPFFSRRVIDKVSKYSPELATLRHLYKVEPDIDNQQLLDLANELQNLDDVEYCDLLGKVIDQTPIPAQPPIVAEPPVPANTPTPDFTSQQGYLDSIRGLNVKGAWDLGATGQGINLRMGGSAIVPEHEDLSGIHIISNGVGLATDADTAGAGVIMARNNDVGMTGIAYDADTYYYHLYSGGIGQFIEDLLPGDVACNPLTYFVNVNENTLYLPILHHVVWWDIYGSLVSSSVVLVLHAGMGIPNGVDLSHSVFEDYGDNGVILAAGSDPQTGRRLPMVNFNLRNFVNVWGKSVASCGYGDLFNPDNDVRRQYTASYGLSGTPSMAAGVLAVLQSHVKKHYKIIFNNWQMLMILEVTGSREGVADLIGFRPNVLAAISYIDRILTLTPTTIAPWDEHAVCYLPGTAVSFDGRLYACKRETISNPGQPPSTLPGFWFVFG